MLLVKHPPNQSYHATNVFLIPAILLLPPELVVAVAIIQHIPTWLKTRTAWYRECFNICNYVIATLAAWGIVKLILQADGLIPNGNLRFAVAGLACSIVLVGINHAMLAPMLMLGHGHSIRESRLFSFHGLSTELVLAALGVVLATFWHINPWLIPFALVPDPPDPPLAVGAEARGGGPRRSEDGSLQRTPLRPRAERGDRARPAVRPAALALIMADLDLLRDINNSYGHLAGDAVLKGVAEVFRTQLRHYDVPARFGGEEFSILLPETSNEEAMEIAERIRQAGRGACVSTSRRRASPSAPRSRSASRPIRATGRTRTS